MAGGVPIFRDDVLSGAALGLGLSVYRKAVGVIAGYLTAAHQRVADHEVDQRRRNAQFPGHVFLWHTVKTVHLKGIARAFR